MKINLLKSGKSALTYLLAFCVLAVSLFTASVAVNAADPAVWNGQSDTDWATWDGTTTNAGTESNPYKITSAEEFYGMATTEGVTGYFKVADGITALYFNDVEGKSASEAIALLEAKGDGIKTYTTFATSGKIGFGGTFDGNGVTIYGVYCAGGSYSGLFGRVDTCTIKNVNVSHSYFQSNNTSGAAGAAAILSSVATGDDTTNNITGDTANIEKVSVTNCKIVNTAKGAAAAIASSAHNGIVNINSCLVADNTIKSEDASMVCGLVGEGWGSAKGNSVRVATDCIVLGVHPFSAKTNSYATTRQAAFNVYTDTAPYDSAKVVSGVTVLASGAAVKGTAAKTTMPNLAWGINWTTTTSGYPVNMSLAYDCFTGAPDTTWDTWDGTTTNAGTASNPYKITTANELYGMVSAKGKVSGNGVYFKVAEGIDVLYCNPVKDVTDIKAYFENANNGKVSWATTANDFYGTFDGNGVTIVGLYNVVTDGTSVGFIPQISGGTATIKNVQFDGCYFQTSGNDNWYVASGVVVGGAVGDNNASTINVEKVVVKNSYSANLGTGTASAPKGNAAAVVGGFRSNDTLNVTDVLTYGNTIVGKASTVGSIAGDPYGSAKITLNISNVVSADDVYFVSKTGKHTSGNVGQNGSALTSETDTVYYSNTYTNVYTVKSMEYATTGVTELTDAQLKGLTLQLEGFDYTNTWVATTSYPELRVFHTITTVPDGDAGHKLGCSDAGCTSNFGDTVAHTYGDDTTCDICSYVHTHDYKDNGEPTTPAGCTSTGVQPTKCVCGAESTRVIPATGHTFGTVVSAEGATCNDKGNVAYKTCSVCEKNFAADAAVDSTTPLATIENADFGAHNWGDEDSVVACNGVHTYFKQCSVCQKYAYSNGNNTSYDETNLKDVAPTAADHSWVAQTPKTSECESVPSVNYKKCDICGKYTVDNGVTVTVDEPAAPAGHAWGTEQLEVSECDPGKNVAYKECANCHKYLVGDDVVDSKAALGHNLGNNELTDGHFVTSCSDCDYATMYVKIETEDYSLFADTGVFEPGETVSVEKAELSENEKAEMLKVLSEEFDIAAEDAVLYNIEATAQNGDPVQPDGSVTIKVAVPSTFSTNVKYYHIYEDGETQKCEEITPVEGEIVIDHFSAIVVADLGVAEEDEEDNTSSTPSTEDKKEDTSSTSSTSSNTTSSTDNKAPTADTTSPATGDNIAVVVAGIVLVVAAAFVLVRKSRKA